MQMIKNLKPNNMKFVQLSKQKKNIKIIKKQDKLIVTGPLGALEYPLSLISKSVVNELFLKKEFVNLFLNKLITLIHSVSNGWFAELQLNGIGYKSFKMQDKIVLDVGYSNLIVYKPTDLIKIKNLKNKIVLFSIDKEYLNTVCFELRQYAKPDVYKGKGILLKNEIIKQKKKARR